MAELIVCVGAGGVGKTTVSSMLGYYYAKKGLRSLVITIDPAQRLRDALGLKSQSEPQKVKYEAAGTLHAFLPDLRQEWQNFLKAHIKKAALLKDISTNPFFNYISEGLPGSLEIICTNIVMRLIETKDYDVIILDTPPSSQSLAFFDVPKKLKKVLKQDMLRAFIKKRHSLFMKITKKLAFFSGNMLDQIVNKLIGSHFFSEVMDFALSIDDLYEPLLDRAKAMEDLLVASSTKFVLVTRLNSASLADAQILKDIFKERGLKITQVIFNQLWPAPLKSLRAELEQIKDVELLEMSENYCKEYNFQQTLLKRGLKLFSAIDCRKLELSPLITDLLINYQNQE